jgi:hypothetical protein
VLITDSEQCSVGVAVRADGRDCARRRERLDRTCECRCRRCNLHRRLALFPSRNKALVGMYGAHIGGRSVEGRSHNTDGVVENENIRQS